MGGERGRFVGVWADEEGTGGFCSSKELPSDASVAGPQTHFGEKGSDLVSHWNSPFFFYFNTDVWCYPQGSDLIGIGCGLQ